MLDPFSCLAIATGIAQFVQFGSELINVTRNIIRAGGTLESVARIEEQTVRLQALALDLRARADALRALGNDKSPFAPDERELKLAAEGCVDSTHQILAFLRKLKIDGPASRLKSLKLAIKVDMRQKQLDEYQNRILAMKVDLNTLLTQAIGNQQCSIFRLLQTLEARDRTMEVHIASQLAKFKDDLKHSLTTSSTHENNPAEAITASIQGLLSKAELVSKTQFLLLSLRYDHIRAREAAISPNHAKTFEWIFHEKSPVTASGEPRKIPFVQWLRSGEGIFWVSGKAGSGKSTLMKFLFEHPQTQAELVHWSRGKRVVMSRHFFWNAGTEIQKSQAGLYRSLCYDILCSCPELLPIVCGDRFSSLPPEQSLKPGVAQHSPWTIPELFSAIHQLSQLEHEKAEDIVFCFFVDGLDEYDGRHDDVINGLSLLCKSSRIKICASSRPWNVFESAFGGPERLDRMLVLQDLTQLDVLQYVKDRLEGDRRFAATLAQDQQYASIAQEVAGRAEGVFLWVFLVINELLDSMTNEDDFHTFLRRLRRMPPGLEPYFLHMFNNLDLFYQAETAQMFRVALKAPFNLSVLTFSVLQPNDPVATRFATQLQEETAPALREQVENSLRKRIKGRCRDLLDVQHHEVCLLHRTVIDFLSTKKMIKLLDERTGAEFDLDVTMCRMVLVGLRVSLDLHRGGEVTNGDPRDVGEKLLVTFFHYIRAVERKQRDSPRELLGLLSQIEGIPAFMHGAPDLLTLFALMHLPLTLREHLGTKAVPRTAHQLNGLLSFNLHYLAPWGAYGDNGMLSILDGERREFDTQSVDLLLDLGANPNDQQAIDVHIGDATPWSIWSMHLESMWDVKENVTWVTKMKFLDATAALMSRGAACDGFKIYSESGGMGSGEPLRFLSEHEALIDLFGKADAERLLALRDQQRTGFTWLRHALSKRWKSIS